LRWKTARGAFAPSVIILAKRSAGRESSQIFRLQSLSAFPRPLSLRGNDDDVMTVLGADIRSKARTRRAEKAMDGRDLGARP
jgi:hypothetical protein